MRMKVAFELLQETIFPGIGVNKLARAKHNDNEIIEISKNG